MKGLMEKQTRSRIWKSRTAVDHRLVIADLRQSEERGSSFKTIEVVISIRCLERSFRAHASDGVRWPEYQYACPERFPSRKPYDRRPAGWHHCQGEALNPREKCLQTNLGNESSSKPLRAYRRRYSRKRPAPWGRRRPKHLHPVSLCFSGWKMRLGHS